VQAAKGKRQMIRGKRQCKGCGELGHGETSYKCRLNGTKKRKRKPRTNTTKYGKNGNKKSKKAAANPPVQGENVVVQEENAAVQPLENVAVHSENATATAVHYENVFVQPPENIATAKATILATIPDRVTRSRLAFVLGEGTSSSPTKQAPKSKKRGVTKKLTPRKLNPN